jgi:hypothetical protein
MSKSKIVAISMIGALAIAAAFGAVAYHSVSAAQSTASTAAFAFTTETRDGPGLGGVSEEDLANALGISVDELATARAQAQAAALEQAVTDGLITQAQADELSTNGSAFPFGGRWGGFLSQNGIDLDTYLADALGITVAELQAATTQAFTDHIYQAVTDGTLTQEEADLILGQRALAADSTFQSSMQSAYESAVNQAVASGVITQAQADQILANSSGMWTRGPGGPGGPGDFDGGRGPRGGEGFGNFDHQIPADSSPTTP